MTRPTTLLPGESCDRSHHSHRHGHHHHHHHHHRGRSPSSTGRSSVASEVSGEQAKSRMRWILSLGLLLPALAAIIGVVAWAVSAEVVMGARRDSAFKLSGPASRFHQAGRTSDEDGEIDRLESKAADREAKTSRTSTGRKGVTKESQVSEPRADSIAKSTSNGEPTSDHHRNTNLYFLAGLDALNSDNRPNFSSLSALDPKKSTGARVAEVIDRLVSQRKKEGSSPHIVVVAPIPESKKSASPGGGSNSNQHHLSTTPPPSPTTTSTSTTSSPSPSSSALERVGGNRNRGSSSFESASFSRDSDTLLAAAHFLARHHMANKRSDDDKFTLSLEPSREEGRRAFESASLLGPMANTDMDHEAPPKRGLAKPVGPPLHHRQSGRIGVSGNHQRNYDSGPMDNGDGAMEESNVHPMASASQHHLTYLPSNRMGQAPSQIIGPIHANQIQYRSGPPPQGPQAPQGPPHQAMYGPIPPQMIRVEANGGNGGGQMMPPPNMQYQPPPHLQQQHQQPQHQPHQHQQQQLQMQQQQQQQPQIIIENGQQYIVGPNQGMPGQYHQFNGEYGQQQQQQQLQMQQPQPQPPQGSKMAASNYAPVFEPNNQGGMPMGPQRPAPYINRDSYVAAESAGPPPLIDFSAQHLPDDEPGGYQESAPAKGITLHFGGGPMGGGGQVMTSPLGIFKTLLLPLLPKPRMNLNGKVVFGVVLEKGVGFGKQKHRPPPHSFGHHFGKRK